VPGNVVLVDSIIQLARSLNLQVVAEGVETEGELNALCAMGCPLVQGYFLSLPAPLADVDAWAARRRRALTTGAR
jgi:EAL domain-containing protein (putative c-di-GMP-specific phosphodiesterase class I)